MAAISQDGTRVVSVSTDSSLNVWDCDTGCELVSLFGHLERVNSVSFSPDGKQVVSASDGTLIIWKFPPLQELIDQTRERFKDRPLTPEERKRYYLE